MDSKTKKNKASDFEKSSMMYFKEIAKFPSLSKDMEFDLWKKYKYNGDEKAKEQLIKSNLKFVVNVAKKYQGFGLPYADLIAEGNIGVMKAIEKFDGEKGNKFITYSVWWIKQMILEAINKRGEIPGESLPDNIDRFETSECCESSFVCNEDYLESNESVQIFKNEAQLQALNTMMSSLSKREHFIITKYYGLDNKGEMTLEAIGKELNLTKERVRQIMNNGIKKMRSSALKNSITSEIYE